MLAKELVKCLNNHLPTLDDILNKFQRSNIHVNESKALLHLKSLRILYDENVGDNNADVITELIERTNVSVVGIGGIHIYKEFYIHRDEYLFEFAGFNDFHRLCLSKIDQCVVLIDDESDDKEIITSFPEDFLDFLCEYNVYYQYLVYGVFYDEESFRENLDKLVNRGFSKMFISQLINGYAAAN